MSTAAAHPPLTDSDNFAALESRVIRTVELVLQEREARASAEAEAADLRRQLQIHAESSDTRNAELESELVLLRHERETVRARVEKLLRQLDTLA